MPKISNDWMNPTYGGQRKTEERNNVKTEDVFFRPKVDQEFVARVVGDFVSFVPHWPRVDDGSKNDEGKIAFPNAEFPDAEERNHKPTRICADDTSSWDRYKDIDAYLEKTKCAFCKLKYQGYRGEIRFAFNVLLVNQEGEKICRILEVPKTVMEEFAKICRDEEVKEFIPEDGLGSVVEPAPIFKMSRPEKNKWSVELHYKKKGGLSVGNGIMPLNEDDKQALRIASKAENEEDVLKGHDLSSWYKKDYMSSDIQKKMFKRVTFELPDHEKNKVGADVVEEFENEIDETEEDIPTVSLEDDEWGAVEEEEVVEETTEETEDSPLW